LEEPNEVIYNKNTLSSSSAKTIATTGIMPTKKKTSNSKTRDWTRWIPSFASLESFSSSSNHHQQARQSQPKLPQHELQHAQSLPSPSLRKQQQHHNRNSSKQEDSKFEEKTQLLVRSASYALQRTGTLNPHLRQWSSWNDDGDGDDGDSEDGHEIIVRRQRPPPPPRIQTAPRKLTKRVSFSSIQIYASTTESLSPSSSLTPDRDDGYGLDSPRDPPPPGHTTTISIDAFEAGKATTTDLNPIPYHLRFAPPPEIPGKDELRRASSLMDDSDGSTTIKRKPKWFKLKKKWKTKSKSSRKWKQSHNQNLPIRVLDATDPKYATHINMAGIVSRSTYTSYEDMY